MRITRRNFLRNTAAAGAVGTTLVLPAAVEADAANPQRLETTADAGLFDLIRQFDTAKAEVIRAQEDLEWLVDEWRHLWPLAPEELLRSANGGPNSNGWTFEADIAGQPLYREPIGLCRKKWKKEFRERNEKACFFIDTYSGLKHWRDTIRDRPLSGKTERSRARNLASRNEALRLHERAMVLAKQYEAETARIREASGVEDAKQRVQDAKVAKVDLENRIFAFPVATLVGLRAKADIALRNRHVDLMRGASGPFSLGSAFADDILRVSAGNACERGAV